MLISYVLFMSTEAQVYVVGSPVHGQASLTAVARPKNIIVKVMLTWNRLRGGFRLLPAPDRFLQDLALKGTLAICCTFSTVGTNSGIA